MIVAGDLDAAGLQPALDESCGGDQQLRTRGLVADQPLRQSALVCVGAGQLDGSAIARNASYRRLSRSATRRRSEPSSAASASDSAWRS